MLKSSHVVKTQLEDELYRRYVTDCRGVTGLRRRLRFLRKQWMWRFVIQTTRLVKRTVDIAGAVLLLTCGSPIFLLVALLIKLTDRGPVLFWQTRVGYRGREFAFPKFRSMVTNAEVLKKTLLEKNDHTDSLTFKMKCDPRVTWIGRILRKTSLDELPQLWCVLKGEMSLVGPRPPVPEEVESYRLSDRRRLEAVPGLTCIWQVRGRGDIPFDEQVLLDVEYIESQSFWLDVKLLFQTVPAVLFGRGAY